MHHRRRRRLLAAFTLVELLVVIGIIAILISLLLPSLQKARQQAQRTQCLSNQRTIAQLCHLYAAQYKGIMPVSVRSNGEWAYSFDMKVSMNPPSGPLGLGLLISEGFLASGTSPAIFHCQAMDTSGTPYPSHCMDCEPGTNIWGAGASWFDTTTAYRIIIAYNYRAPSYYRANQNKHLIHGKTKPDLLLLMDMPDPRFGNRHTHNGGYNFVRIDSSGGWFSDKIGRIDQMAGYVLPVDGVNLFTNDEQIYSVIEKD